MSASSSTTKMIGFTPQFYLRIVEDTAFRVLINQTFTIPRQQFRSSLGITASNSNGGQRLQSASSRSAKTVEFYPGLRVICFVLSSET